MKPQRVISSRDGEPADIVGQREETFRLLIDGVKEYAIFMLDPAGRVTTWNTGAERIKGYRADEVIGKHFSMFYPEADVRAGKTERALEAAVRDGRYEEEGWRVRKGGTTFWANAIITALHDDAGRLRGFAKVTRDLTDRRRHEEEQLELARTQEALRLRDEFLSIASHELRTPLTVVRLQLEALTPHIAELAPALLAKFERAQRGTRRLDELVETLLDVARIASGRFELQPRELALCDLARDTVERMRDLADAAGCAITTNLEREISGLWDASRVEQILTNLIGNAIKYAAGAPIEVTTTQHDGLAVIEVRDHGPGLPDGSEGRVFERFERASSMRHFGGLGLGLYVVSEIAKAHHGSVSAANEPGGGARFRVMLPLRPPR